MNNKERLIKFNELENRARSLNVAFPPLPSYSIYLNNDLKEEGIGKNILKAYYKFILQFWMSPQVPVASLVETFDNMHIKSYNDIIGIMNFTNNGLVEYPKADNDKWMSIFYGYKSSNNTLDNIVIGNGVTSNENEKNSLDRNKLVSQITWTKSETTATNNISHDPTTGIYTKKITAKWSAGASDEDRIIKEVGLMYNMSIRNPDVTIALAENRYLFDRAELETPITVKKTDTFNVTYTIKYQVPWNTAS
jgi:hypothetical protein